ncbi:MAG: hypothetical protein IIZ49_04915, partial [Oscillospiraceae bacterium]|nr:hypothetical protein [Oscillospiraceae bacterium]
MKKDELFKALEEIDPASVQKARLYKANRFPAWIKWTAVACAAVLIGAVCFLPALRGREAPYPVQMTASGLGIVRTLYPEPVGKDMDAQQFEGSASRFNWLQEVRARAEQSRSLQGGMEEYYTTLLPALLVSEKENTVCSPLNTYIAFSMLAEVSGGNTRAQILRLLGKQNIEDVRESVRILWESNYADTPMTKCLLANSLWLNKAAAYNSSTLNLLAKQYYASSFSGTPGTEVMDKALRAWTDENTGGLLSEYTKDMSLSPDTVLEILSTIYFKTMWRDVFSEQSTTQETFHGTKGDTTVDMMHKTDMMSVYRTEAFTSLGLSLLDSGSMFFFLPKEGTDVNALASDPDILRAIRFDAEDAAWSSPEVRLSVPKFRVSAKTDLLAA